MAPSNYEEPGFASRILARFIDGFVLLLPLILLAIAFDGVTRLVLTIVLAAAYEIGMTAGRGQTIGKSALQLRIIDAETGDTPDLQQLAVRWLVLGIIASVISYFVPGLLGGLYSLVVAIPALRGPLHQGLHDRAGGTLVTTTR